MRHPVHEAIHAPKRVERSNQNEEDDHGLSKVPPCASGVPVIASHPITDEAKSLDRIEDPEWPVERDGENEREKRERPQDR